MKKNCFMSLFGVNWDNFWLYLTILCDTWKYFVIPENTLWYLTILWYLPILLQYFPKLNNTYKFLTIPDKPDTSWYCLVSTKHQVSTPIQFLYCEGIITIWFWQFFCLSGIVMVLILAIFTKPLMLTGDRRVL